MAYQFFSYLVDQAIFSHFKSPSIRPIQRTSLPCSIAGKVTTDFTATLLPFLLVQPSLNERMYNTSSATSDRINHSRNDAMKNWNG